MDKPYRTGVVCNLRTDGTWQFTHQEADLKLEARCHCEKSKGEKNTHTSQPLKTPTKMNNSPYPQKNLEQTSLKKQKTQNKTKQKTQTKHATKKTPTKFARLVWALFFLKQEVTLYL